MRTQTIKFRQKPAIFVKGNCEEKKTQQQIICFYCVVSRIPYAPRSPVASACLEDLQLEMLVKLPVLRTALFEVFKPRNEHLFVCQDLTECYSWMPCGESLAEYGNLPKTEEEVNILYHFILKGSSPWCIRIVHSKLQEPRQLTKQEVNFYMVNFTFTVTCPAVLVNGSALH